MTKYKEALEWLKTNKDWLDFYEFPKEYRVIFEELLKKEIPTKPILRVRGYTTNYECPHCGLLECRVNDEDEQGYGGDYITPDRCISCGGALNWSSFLPKMLSYRYNVERRWIEERTYIERGVLMTQRYELYD